MIIFSFTSPITCQVLNCRGFSCVQVFTSKTCKLCQKYMQIGHACTLINSSRMRSPTHRLVRGVGCAHLSQYTIFETLLRTLTCKSGVSNEPLYCREAKENYIKASPPLGRKACSRNALWRAPSMYNFFRVALPHRYLHTGSSTQKIIMNIPCNCSWFPKVIESQVDEAPECGCSKSNAHPRG